MPPADPFGSGSFAALPLRVVLAESRNPLNIGAAARAMSNFGFCELRLVKPYEVAFREARSAVRSHYILEQAQVFETVSEAVADCALVVGTTALGHRNLHVPLYRLESAALQINKQLGSLPVALLFGSEKFGLSNEHLSHCHWALRIPTREQHGSMNLGQAVAICLYELRRGAAGEAKGFLPRANLSGAEAERLTVLLLELLSRSGYVRENTAASSEHKLRRLVRRAGIAQSDADTWIGMVRQILWKVRQSDSK